MTIPRCVHHTGQHWPASVIYPRDTAAPPCKSTPGPSRGVARAARAALPVAWHVDTRYRAAAPPPTHARRRERDCPSASDVRYRRRQGVCGSLGYAYIGTRWHVTPLSSARHHLSLSRLNHWLPRGQAHPEVVQGTTEFGRVSDVHLSVVALHDLIGMTVGQSSGRMLSRSLSAGGLSMTWRGVKRIAETRPIIRIAQVRDLLFRYTRGP
jgi:hypothetical protein